MIIRLDTKGDYGIINSEIYFERIAGDDGDYKFNVLYLEKGEMNLDYVRKIIEDEFDIYKSETQIDGTVLKIDTDDNEYDTDAFGRLAITEIATTNWEGWNEVDDEYKKTLVKEEFIKEIDELMER